VAKGCQKRFIVQSIHGSPDITTSENQQPQDISLPKRNIILIGSGSTAQKKVAGIKKNGLFLANSIVELNTLISPEQNPDRNINKINSIILLIYPGDDIFAVKELYNIALEINVLVTTIIIYKPGSMPINPHKSLSKIRSISNMVVITSDENYLEYMLDCML
jgi:hypothetical protein